MFVQIGLRAFFNVATPAAAPALAYVTTYEGTCIGATLEDGGDEFTVFRVPGIVTPFLVVNEQIYSNMQSALDAREGIMP